MKTFAKMALLALFLTISYSKVAIASDKDDTIHIVGSSTVYPFVTAVAEQFGKDGKFKTPIVESTGTGSGFKLFCAGIDKKSPDAINASRPIKDSEKELCAKNGAKEIMELKIGFDGIVLGQSVRSGDFDISKYDLQQALAAKILKDGKLINNPYKKWSDIRQSLPARDITIYGPPTTSGTRDAIVELIMDAGCDKSNFPQKLSAKDIKVACETMREDYNVCKLTQMRLDYLDSVILKKTPIA